MNKILIGFFAMSGDVAACHNDSLVVINQKKIMKNYLRDMSGSQDFKLLKTYLSEILRGLDMGGVYDLDEIAYAEFKEHVDVLDLSVEDHVCTDSGLQFKVISKKGFN